MSFIVYRYSSLTFIGGNAFFYYEVAIAKLGAGENLIIPNSSFDVARECRYVLNGNVFGYIAFYNLCVHHFCWINSADTECV